MNLFGKIKQFFLLHKESRDTEVINPSVPVTLTATVRETEKVISKRGEKLQIALYRISEAAHLALTLDELYKSIYSIIQELIPVKNFYIALYDENTDLCDFPFHIDEFDTDWEPIPPGKSLTGYVLRTSKPLLATPEVFIHLVQAGECELIGRQTVDWLGVPLITQKRTIGVLVVQTYPGDSRLGEKESEILTFVSGQIAMVIERKQAEAELRESQQRLFNITQGSPIPTFVIDKEHKVTHWNRALEELTHIKFENVVGTCQHWKAFYHQERPCLADLLVDEKYTDIPSWYSSKTSKSSILSEAYQASDFFPDLGETGKWLHFTAAVIRSLSGDVIGALETLTDITEERLAADALRQSEEQFQLMFDLSPIGMSITSLDGKYLRVNEAFCNILGYTKEEILSFTLEHVSPAEDVENSVRMCDEVLQGKATSFQMERRYISKTGETNFTLLSVVLARDKHGKPLHFISQVVDITKRKHAEQSLRESEQRFRLAMEATSEGLWDWNIHDDRGYYGPGYYQMLGYEPGEFPMTGESWRERIHTEEKEFALKANQDCIENRVEVFETEYRMRTKSGDWKWILSRGSAVSRDENGKALRMVGTHMDITERKQREQEMEVITSVSSALRSANTPDEMMKITLDQTVKLLRATIGGLELIDPANGDSVVEVSCGEGALPPGTRIPMDKGLNTEIRATGKAYVNNHVQSDSRALEKMRLSGIPALAGAPMIAQGEWIGFLWIGRSTEIMESELRPLTAIADITANALRRARLFELTEVQLRRLAGLRKIDMAINSSQDLRATIKVVLEQVLEELQANAASVYQWNSDLLKLECVARKGFRSSTSYATDFAVHESPAAKAILEKAFVHIPDLSFAGLPGLNEEGFMSYFAVPLIVKGQVKGALEVLHCHSFTPDQEWLDFLETLAGQAAIAIDNVNLFQGMQRSNLELSLAYDATIEGWSRVLDLRDKETEGHSQRVTDMTIALVVKLGVRGENLVHIRRGALLHDIGKMGVPDRILLKPDKLTDEEWVIMSRHPQYAWDMLSPIDYLRPALDIPYCHHEKWNGTGYPRGLKGEQIPLAARIFAIVDVWDALLSDRPYRKSWTKEHALQYIQEQAGIHFDPRVVKEFLIFIEQE